MLAFGGVVFYAIIIFYILLSIGTLENHRGQAAFSRPFTLFVVLVVILGFAYHKEFGEYFRNAEFRQFILPVIGYVVIGLLWSFYAWYLFVRKVIATKQYVQGIEISGYTDVKNNVSQISAWIVFWPISVLRYILGDLFSHLFNRIVLGCKNIYDAITKAAYK